MTGHLARALIEDLDDQALDELAALLAPRLVASETAPTPAEPPLSPAVAAARLRLHRRTIYRAIGSDELPAQKVRGLWRIAPEDLDRWAQRAPAERRRPSPRSRRRASESTNQAVAAIARAT